MKIGIRTPNFHEKSPDRRRLEMSSPSRIAVIKLRGLGDTVLWIPALKALKATNPEAQIAAFCPERWRDLVSFFPGVDKSIGIRNRSFLGLLGALRAFKPDAVLSFHATPRTALAAFFSGAKTRIVRNHSGPDYFSTITVTSAKEAKGAYLRDMDVVEALTSERREKGDWEIGRSRDGGEGSQRRAEALIREGYLGVPTSVLERARKIVAGWGNEAPLILCPGASKMTNEWPEDRWVVLVRHLGEKGILPVIHAGPDEERWIKAFEKAGLSFHRLEAPDLPLLAGIFALSKLCLASDSGPKHLAAAVGCPTLTIWGSTLFREWHPYDQERHPVVLAPVPCRPCFRNSCDHLSCLRGIEVADVLSRLLPFLKRET